MFKDKFTDEEIVEALEHCANWEGAKDCESCPFCGHGCRSGNMEKAWLDLIHRLQEDKARLIDKLKEEEGWYKLAVDGQKEALAQAEMYKENLKNEKKWGKIQVKQAEKYTAKKILEWLVGKRHLFNRTHEIGFEKPRTSYLIESDEIEELAEKYGVEVE